MNRVSKRWNSVIGLWLIGIICSAASAYGIAQPAYSRTIGIRSNLLQRETNAASPSVTADQWTCWLDGAGGRQMPLSQAATAPVRLLAGQVLDAESIEVTPLGEEWLRVRAPKTGAPLWVPLAYVRRVAPENAIGGDLPIGREQIGPYHGLPLDYCPSDLVQLPARYCFSDQPQRLRAEAAEALRRMVDTAQQEAGLRIRVLSAFRSAATQAYLCRRKISATGIEQRDVARPGHSEHQLGTAVDLTAANGLHLLTERFGETREGRWLAENCTRFGFVPSYSRARALREGTPYEPWHFRYVGRLNVEKFKKTLE